MFLYVAAVASAAILQIGVIYILRGGFSLVLFLYTLPLVLAAQFLFLWSYASAPRFIIIWFIGTALTNILAVMVGYLFLHERISIWDDIGIVLILTGVVLMNIK